MTSREKIRSKYDYYFTYDIPIPFVPRKYRKDNEVVLHIKPFIVKDYYKFANFSQCLQYDKDSIKDVDIVRMTYLEYLLYLFTQNSKGEIKEKDENGEVDSRYDAQSKFILLLSYVFSCDINDISLFYNSRKKLCIGLGQKIITYQKTEEISPMSKMVVLNVTNENNHINIKDLNENFKLGDIVEEVIDYEIEISSRDFDEIKQIILYQNINDYDDTYIDPILKWNLEEERRLRNKGSEDITTSLLKQIITICMALGYKKEEVLNLTILTFSEMLKMIVSKEQYEIMMKATMSGMVKIEKLPIHYLYERDCSFDGMQSVDKFSGNFGKI